jgi:hypothetical protein
MGTWAAIFVNSNELDQVTGTLKQLSAIDTLHKGEFPTSDLYNNILVEDNAGPTYLVFAQTQPDWIMIRHNALQNLEGWGKTLSASHQTKVIICSAQSNADFYHFSLYDQGTMLRKIEYCYGDDYEPINQGNRFAFENEEPGVKMEYAGEVSYIFDFDSIEEYAKHFGLEVQPDYDSITEWCILKTKSRYKTLGDYKKSLKPWWKFW